MEDFYADIDAVNLKQRIDTQSITSGIQLEQIILNYYNNTGNNTVSNRVNYWANQYYSSLYGKTEYYCQELLIDFSIDNYDYPSNILEGITIGTMERAAFSNAFLDFIESLAES